MARRRPWTAGRRSPGPGSRLASPTQAFVAFARAAELARANAPAPRLREVLRAWADALAAVGRHAEAYELAREALSSEGPPSERFPVQAATTSA